MTGLSNQLRLPRRGIAMIWAVVVLVALMGFCSLAVDYGRVQLVKTELQRAADAACRYGVTGLVSGLPDLISAAQSRAVAAAADNLADNQSVVLNSASDVEFGTWNPTARTFTVLSGTARSAANALRVTARRTAAAGNPIRLTFAPIIGFNTCNVSASAIATVATGNASATGFIGLNSFGMDHKTGVASYRSSAGPPSKSNTFANAAVGSNGQVSLSNKASVNGDVLLGPGATIWNSGDISGSQKQLTSPMTFSAVDAGNAAAVNDNNRIGLTNKGHSPLTGNSFYMADNETISIPGGTYYFNTFWISNSAQVTFTGPATVYVASSFGLDSNAEVDASGNVPGNLQLRAIGGASVWLSNNSQLTANFYGPGASFGFGQRCPAQRSRRGLHDLAEQGRQPVF